MRGERLELLVSKAEHLNDGVSKHIISIIGLMYNFCTVKISFIIDIKFLGVGFNKFRIIVANNKCSMCSNYS